MAINNKHKYKGLERKISGVNQPCQRITETLGSRGSIEMTDMSLETIYSRTATRILADMLIVVMKIMRIRKIQKEEFFKEQIKILNINTVKPLLRETYEQWTTLNSALIH